MSKRRPFQSTKIWRDEMAARQATPDNPSSDLVRELVEALDEALIYIESCEDHEVVPVTGPTPAPFPAAPAGLHRHP